MRTFEMTTLSRFVGVRRFVQRAVLTMAMAGLWMGGMRSVSAATNTAIDRDAFLNAIAQVETGGNARAVGRQGERGMYQFNRTTWRLHTTRAFMDAHNPAVSYDVAVRHYEWLLDGLQRGGRQPSAYLMAAAWNAGLSRAINGRAPASTRDYARRVVNIVSTSRPSPGAPTVVARVLVADTSR